MPSALSCNVEQKVVKLSIMVYRNTGGFFMKDILSYLKIFYQGTYLPVSYYQSDQLRFQIPEVLGFNLRDHFLYKFAKPKKTVNFYVTESGLLWGVICDFTTDKKIIVGPACSIHPNQELILAYMAEFAVPIKHLSEVEDFFYASPSFSVNQFAHLLSVLNAYINDTLFNTELLFEHEPANSLDAINMKSLSSLCQAKETGNIHNSFQLEQKMCHYIEKGNVEALKALLHNSHNIHSGIMGATPSRQEKNKFIAIITLVTRHSIYGGLDVETAYQLSDTYIMESEKMPNINEIDNLAYIAILDFAKRVAENKIPTGISADVFKSIQFISTHTNQPLSVKDVAEAAGKSVSLISKKFKKETGVNLSDFITRKKLDEGKNLLVYSDKSISEISVYLCFSSQPYFQNLFKKLYGVTPAQYRKEHRCRK